ncbi:MAG: TonB-dependent receptor [Haliscomenobacter sp.]|uniref:TonB-dependent receptor n=1 Tax=Haliscomenobacter sp. TaxID=2717303 RepID=UPI0029BF714D|nr:TonB-dependent receptor [Haliscomenobacter sp.]MDX2071957.1 TonB-dependent receptor [Haliscomenobacter sp.]
MRTAFVLAISFLFLSTFLGAQSGEIRGTVTDSEGKASAFVNIQLREIQQGVSSDLNGSFVFPEVKAGAYTLVASYIGYKTLTQSVDVEAGKVLNLSLELFENAETLKEIVIKGYVTQNERITSIGKMAARQMDLPMSFQTLDRQTLESQQALTMQDVLMNTNGVYVMGATGGYQEEIAGRGFAYGSNNTFKNGTRFVNSMLPELSSLERVEILKGSAALLFGNVAPGGVLNLVTKKPKFGFGGEVGLRLGSFGLLKPNFDIYGGIGKGEKVAFRLNGTYQSANSFRQYVSSERVYINPSLLFKLGKKTELLLEGDYLDDRRTPDFGAGIVNYEVIPDYPRDRFLGVKWGYVDSKQWSSTATLTHRFNDKWKLNLSSAYRDTEQEVFGTTRPNQGTLIKADGLWTRNIQRNASTDNYFIVQGDVNGTFNTGRISHQLLLGFDTDHFVQQTQQYAQLNGYDVVNIFEDLPSNSRNDIPTLKKGNFSDNPTSRYGVFIQDLIALSTKFKALAGIRYSSQKLESNVTTAEGQLTTTPSPREGAFSPRLGIVFQPNSNQSAFVSYSNSFSFNTGVDIEGKVLPPSIIDQYEVGVKNELFKGRASANITLYRIDNDKLAQNSLVNGNTYTYIKELAGAVRSRGVEVDFSARLTSNLIIIAGYSFNETKYIKSNTYVVGSLLRYNPNHTANASVQYAVGEGKLKGLNLGFVSAYIGTRYAGRSTRVQVANDAYRITEIADYFQFDATAGYNFSTFALRAKLANIFNVLSYNVHDDNSVNPIAPRNFSVSLTWKF